MLVKTRGIVLNYIRFRETSIIARIYTEELGLQSYIINGLRNKGTATRIALFQPFTLLSLVAYDTRKGSINRLSEYRCEHHFHKIPYDIRKSSIIIFLSEILSRSVREEEPNPMLYTFLHDAILGFDEMEDGFENFHLFFLLQLSWYLGFGPGSGAEITEQVS
ncbi:MAG: DNA repair protein RecO, partial [Sphingobacteriales bacterium]